MRRRAWVREVGLVIRGRRESRRDGHQPGFSARRALRERGSTYLPTSHGDCCALRWRRPPGQALSALSAWARRARSLHTPPALAASRGSHRPTIPESTEQSSLVTILRRPPPPAARAALCASLPALARLLNIPPAAYSSVASCRCHASHPPSRSPPPPALALVAYP